MKWLKTPQRLYQIYIFITIHTMEIFNVYTEINKARGGRINAVHTLLHIFFPTADSHFVLSLLILCFKNII